MNKDSLHSDARGEDLAGPVPADTLLRTKVDLVVCAGVEGPSVYLNDYRIAGPKPWGGGKTTHKFSTTIGDIERALGTRNREEMATSILLRIVEHSGGEGSKDYDASILFSAMNDARNLLRRNQQGINEKEPL